jgi:hypothetical protein
MMMNETQLSKLSHQGTFYIRDLESFTRTFEKVREGEFLEYPERLRVWVCRAIDFAANHEIGFYDAWNDIKVASVIEPSWLHLTDYDKRSYYYNKGAHWLANCVRSLKPESKAYNARVRAIAGLVPVVTSFQFLRDLYNLCDMIRMLALDYELDFNGVWFNVMFAAGCSPFDLMDNYLLPWKGVA